MFSSISICRKKRESPNNEPRKNKVAWNGVQIKLEPGTVKTFELFPSDDDAYKKPRAKKNIYSVADMMIHTGDNREHEHDDELDDGNVWNDDYELQSEEEEEAGDENKERKRGR